jgi:DNA-binding protein HU-beta
MAATIGKSDLIDAISEKCNCSKKDAGAALDAAIGAIVAALQRGDKVQLTGFGAFEVRTRQARKGKNLQTGATIDIPESKVPAFKAGKGLKDAVK